MAVTIVDIPQLISPATNPLTFTFTSDQTAQANFTFVVELYINGSLHSTHQRLVQNANAGRLDVSDILRAFLVSDLNPNGSMDMDHSASYATYYIIVRESYGTPAAIQANATSSTVTAFNGALRHQDWIDFNYTAYNIESGAGKLFLTEFPRTQDFYCSDSQMVFLGSLNTDSLDYYVDVYDINDVLVASDNTMTGKTDSIVITDFSPQSIIADLTITQANFDASHYYEVWFRSTNFTSEKFRIYIDRTCSQFTPVRLHWLNRFGAFDSFTFTLLSETSGTVERVNYSKQLGEWNGTSYDYNLNDGRKRTASTMVTETLLINSDWIHQDVQNWLVQGLTYSPMVFMEVGTKLEPVQIQTNQFRLKQRFKDGLIQEQFTLTRSYTHKSQLA